MLTVYGRATSSNVQAVMWCIGELGLDYERLDIGHAHGGNRTPDYLAMNPNGLVPVVRDDGGAPMFESAAIVRYLACKYGDETFWPREPGVRAQLDMWADWIKTSFGPAFGNGVFFPMVIQPVAQRDHAAISAAIEKLKPLALILDARLREGPYLDGEHFSFADIICGHLMHRYFTHEFDRADTPALISYFEALQARPAYREHAMVSYEPLRAKP